MVLFMNDTIPFGMMRMGDRDGNWETALLL